MLRPYPVGLLTRVPGDRINCKPEYVRLVSMRRVIRLMIAPRGTRARRHRLSMWGHRVCLEDAVDGLALMRSTALCCKQSMSYSLRELSSPQNSISISLSSHLTLSAPQREHSTRKRERGMSTRLAACPDVRRPDSNNLTASAMRASCSNSFFDRLSTAVRVSG